MYILTLRNLSGNGQRLEKGSLLRTQTSVMCRDDNRQRSDGTRTGRRADFVFQELVTDFHKVSTGEHEADVSLDVRHQLLKVGIGFKVVPDGLTHHGILAHEHDAGPSQRDTYLLHLGGTHIVCTHDEAFWVLV